MDFYDRGALVSMLIGAIVIVLGAEFYGVPRTRVPYVDEVAGSSPEPRRAAVVPIGSSPEWLLHCVVDGRRDKSDPGDRVDDPDLIGSDHTKQDWPRPECR